MCRNQLQTKRRFLLAFLQKELFVVTMIQIREVVQENMQEPRKLANIAGGPGGQLKVAKRDPLTYRHNDGLSDTCFQVIRYLETLHSLFVHTIWSSALVDGGS